VKLKVDFNFTPSYNRIISCWNLYYSNAPRNDVSVNDGPHIRRW